MRTVAVLIVVSALSIVALLGVKMSRPVVVRVVNEHRSIKLLPISQKNQQLWNEYYSFSKLDWIIRKAKSAHRDRSRTWPERFVWGITTLYSYQKEPIQVILLEDNAKTADVVFNTGSGNIGVIFQKINPRGGLEITVIVSSLQSSTEAEKLEIEKNVNLVIAKALAYFVSTDGTLLDPVDRQKEYESQFAFSSSGLQKGQKFVDIE